MKYRDELKRAMDLLVKDERTIFIGQDLVHKGNYMDSTLVDVPTEKKIELPVMEDAQLGMVIGLSLEGYIPICIYPRMDFLILAMNQLVNHLDKIGEMSEGRFKPKVIIRTGVGASKPLYPGLQHTGDYHFGLRKMLKNVKVIKLHFPIQIVSEYEEALKDNKSHVIIEMADLYDYEVKI